MLLSVAATASGPVHSTSQALSSWKGVEKARRTGCAGETKWAGGIAAYVRPVTPRDGHPAGSLGTSTGVVPELNSSSSAHDWLPGGGGVILAVPAHCQSGVHPC